MTKRRIQQCRAIVTGASSGIGREIALELARQGAVQVLTARREARLRELADQIATLGARAEIVVGDVTEDASPERIRRIMEVNFFALVEMTRVALPALKEGNRPIVVNIGSVLGHRGVPYRSDYCASKFAVEGFSEAIRAELGPHGIDVLVVSPGATESEFADRVIEHTGEPDWPNIGRVSAAVVARQTVRAIRCGRHEIIPNRRAKVLYWLNRISPGLVDRFTARYVEPR